MNKTWHEANPLPQKPTPKQYLEWHEAHAHYCGCHPIATSLRQKIAKLTPKTKLRATALDCD